MISRSTFTYSFQAMPTYPPAVLLDPVWEGAVDIEPSHATITLASIFDAVFAQPQPPTPVIVNAPPRPRTARAACIVRRRTERGWETIRRFDEP